MKTICIYHSVDLDGWMSAAIVKYWHTMEVDRKYLNINNNDTTEVNSINFIGYTYGQPIPDLSEYDKVIMCDISFPKDEMLKLEQRLGSKFIWIDHHISAINEIHLNKEGFLADGIRDVRYAACELTWCYFFPNDMDNMPELVTLLGLYDSFRSKGTEEHQKVLEFQYGARQCITNYEEAYQALQSDIQFKNDPSYSIVERILTSGETVYQYLCTEAKQSYKNGFEIKFDIVNETIKAIEGHNNSRINFKFICINKERFNPINFGIDYHKDGYDGAACFHMNYNPKTMVKPVWLFSLYNDNNLVDCSIIAKQFGGGGHKGAAGFVTEDLSSIINSK